MLSGAAANCSSAAGVLDISWSWADAGVAIARVATVANANPAAILRTGDMGMASHQTSRARRSCKRSEPARIDGARR
ncbi:hypothetical protein GCM10009587_13400 [Microbacterium maritypicum]